MFGMCGAHTRCNFPAWTRPSPQPFRRPRALQCVTPAPEPCVDASLDASSFFGWVIEQLFRTIETKGFDIERVSMETAPFRTLVAGISCLQMVQGRDGRAQRPLQDAFEVEERPALEAVSATLEGKTEKQKNPHPKGSLAFAAWVCARLGGWTGYYGKPGPVVMLNGLYRFRAIQRGYRIEHHV